MNRLMLGTFAVFVFVLAWSQDLVEPDKASEDPVNAEVSAETVGVSDNVPSLDDPTRAEVNQAPSTSDSDGNREKPQIEFPEDAHDSIADDWSWNLDRALQAAGIVGLLGVIILTLLALMKSTHANQIAQETTKKTLRPWIVCHQLKKGKSGVHWFDDELVLEVKSVFKNVGLTPAQDVWIDWMAYPRFGPTTAEEALFGPTTAEEAFQKFLADSRIQREAARSTAIDIFPGQKAEHMLDFSLTQEDRYLWIGRDNRGAKAATMNFSLVLFVAIFYDSPLDDPKVDKVEHVTAYGCAIKDKDHVMSEEEFIFEVHHGVPPEDFEIVRGIPGCSLVS